MSILKRRLAVADLTLDFVQLGRALDIFDDNLTVVDLELYIFHYKILIHFNMTAQEDNQITYCSSCR